MEIPQNVIDDILSRVSIVDLIGSYIELKDNGTESLGLCPFHSEKTPSFSVSDEKGLYHCFGCGAGGNAADFLVAHEHIGFRKAIKRLAQIAQVDVAEYYKKDGKSAHPSETRRVSQYKYIDKLKANLEAFKDSPFSYLVTAYRMEGESRQHERENYYPTVDKKTGETAAGSPAYALSPKQFSYFQTRSKEQKRMFHFGTSLFGDKVTKNAASGVYYKSKAAGNATHCLSVSLEYDNLEFKDQRKKPEYKNTANLEKLLAQTKEKMLEQIKIKLTSLKLWECAAVIDSGTGIHVHLILDKVEPYQKLDAMGENNKFKAGEMYDYVMQTLILETGSDPASGKRTSTYSLVPDLQYWKLGKPIPIRVIKDAEKFAKFQEILARTLDSGRDMEQLEKEFNIYNASFDLFKGQGRAPDPEFIQSLKEIFKKKPTKDSIIPYFEEYITQGILPGGETDNKWYNGREEWPCGDGSIIQITKSFQMKYIKTTAKQDAEGNVKYDKTPVAIPCTWALIPLYLVEDERNETQFSIIFDCLTIGRKKRILIEGSKFGTKNSLQQALRLHQVDITLNDQSTRALCSYAFTYAKQLKNIEVGVSYQKDSEGKVTGSMLAGYDYIYANNKVYKGEAGIIKAEDETFWIKGYEKKHSNMESEYYTKAKPSPDGKVDQMINGIDRLFKSKWIGRMFASYLGVCMLREPLYDKFKSVPFLSLHGESGCGKTTLVDTASYVFNQKPLRQQPTISTTIKEQKYRRNGVLLFDEMDENQLYKMFSFLKDCVTNAFRNRQGKDGEAITNDQILNTTIISTNNPIHRMDEAINFRSVKIFFTKATTIFDTDAHSDYYEFIRESGFDIVLDLYNRISGISITELNESIKDLKKQIVKLLKKDERLCQGYAMMLAVGQAIGIDIHLEEILEFIRGNENDAGSDKDVLTAAILDLVEHQTKDNQLPADLPVDPETKVVLHQGGATFLQEYTLSLKRLNAHIQSNKILLNMDHKGLLKEIYRVPYIEVIRTSHTVKIQNQWCKENGILLKINFGHEIFTNQLHQNITLDTKRIIDKNEYKKVAHCKWCRLRQESTDEPEEKSPEKRSDYMFDDNPNF